MGRDKALLPFRGTTLIEHALATARKVTDDVCILSGPSRRYQDHGVPVVEDEVCGGGPIGGLYSALLSASIEGRGRIFWLGVDMPLVPASLLARLVAGLDQAEVVMARTTRGLEPMCAAFRTAPTLERVRRALVEGRLKLTTALQGLALQVIDADDGDLTNVNSPAEYSRLTGLNPRKAEREDR